MKTAILIDPELPPDFYCTPNNERSPEEIEAWWCVPYIHTDGELFNVRRLDGGAWDRPTNHGVFDTLDEAIETAEGLRTR